jgi:plasmid stabilization system protein ParE
MSVARIPTWRPKAWDDIEGHAVSVGSAGLKFLESINKTLELLCLYPELGGVFETSNPRLVGVRAMRVSDFHRFVVFYRPLANAIEVVRVFGGGQDMYALINAEA